MSIKSFLFFIFLFLSFQIGRAEVDKYYIKDLSDKITFKPYLSRTALSFNYMLPNNQKTEVYKPNTSFDLGLGISHKWFSIWYSYGIANSGSVQDFGKTKYWDIQADIYAGKSIVELVYQNFKGFYASKIATVSPFYFDSLPSIVRPDMRINNIAAHYLYIFNGNRLSFRANYSQSQIQKHSAGSFLMGASLSYFTLRADSSILNRTVDPTNALGLEDHYKDGYFLSPSVRFGYAYNLVMLKSLSIMLCATPGLSFTYSDYSIKGGKEHNDFNINFQGQLRYGVQWNSKFFFIGADGVTDIYNYNLYTTNILFISSRAELFAGFRINAPRWLCKKCPR